MQKTLQQVIPLQGFFVSKSQFAENSHTLTGDVLRRSITMAGLF
jgi:hypothetical protein